VLQKFLLETACHDFYLLASQIDASKNYFFFRKKKRKEKKKAFLLYKNLRKQFSQ